jgi:hypothetical protein
MVRPTHIIIHHSLTKDSATVSWGAIRKYHMETLGWKDIGYHFGLELIGDHYEVLMGRTLSEDGAHCKEGGMNRCGIGICVAGNYDIDDLPEPALALLVRLVRSLQAVFVIPAANVQRHSDYATYKSCPGTKFPWQRFKEAISGPA